MKIAAVYSAYNPDMLLLNKSISILHNQVERIIVVDNSDNFDCTLFKDLIQEYNIKVISCNGNTGIADALNRGCDYALNKGFDWVITMDQDSIVANDIIEMYKKFLSENEHLNIGALMPVYSTCFNSLEQLETDNKEIYDYMTSGSLINLNTYRKIRGFNKELFIDMVDTDYGLRLIKNGYKIFRIGSSQMQHNIGNATELTFMGKHVRYITHHNYIRRYYITRNLLWLASEYGKEFPKHNHPYWSIFKSVIRFLLFETDKKRKFKSVIMGIKDYRKNIYGPLKSNCLHINEHR